MKKTLRWLDVNFEAILMVLFFSLMILLVTVQVVLRFIFKTGFSWGEEVARLLFVWMSFSSFGYLTRGSLCVGVAKSYQCLDRLLGRFHQACHGCACIRGTHAGPAGHVPQHVVHGYLVLQIQNQALRRLVANARRFCQSLHILADNGKAQVVGTEHGENSQCLSLIHI